jgi:hypothetical protein
METTTKSKVRNRVLYITVFILIYATQETLLFGDTSNHTFINIAQLSNFIIILLCLIAPKNLDLRDKRIRLAMPLFLLVCMWITYVINIRHESISHYILKSGILLGAYMVTITFDADEFFRAFEKIFYFFAVFALLTYFVAYLLPGLLNKLPIATNSMYVPYYSFIFSNLGTNTYLGSSFYRLQGVFREPGVYSIYLCIVLFLLLFRNDKINIKYVLICLLSTILTFSTTGYVSVAILFFAFFMEKVDRKKVKFKRILFILFAIVLFYGLFYTNLLGGDGIIFSKLSKGNDTYISGIARFASFYVNIYVFLHNPIFGYGVYALNDVYRDLSFQLMGMSTGDNTNSFLFNFAAHGILYGSTMMLGWMLFLKRKSNGILSFILLALAFILALSCEYILNNMIFYIIVFYGYSRIKCEPTSIESRKEG